MAALALLRRFPCWFLTKGFSVSQEWSLRVSRTQVQEPAGTRLQEGPSGLPTLGTRAVPPPESGYCAVPCLQSRAGRLTAASMQVAASCPGTLPTSSSCGPASVQQSTSSLWGGTSLQDSLWTLGEETCLCPLAGRKPSLA